jgi:hypothetical protein
MQREELFSQSGFYGFLLQSNVLLHREAAAAAVEAVGVVLNSLEPEDPVGVLDLACGGWPVTIAEVMEAFPDTRFAYTGVDINPDQVKLAANEFPFPDNVIESRLVEGNAWELADLRLDEVYPIIFSGMNLHHGTPEEILFLGLQLRERLASGGLFFSHDVYRPEGERYRSRPEVIDGATSWLVNPARLEEAGASYVPVARDDGPSEPDWRNSYVESMYRALVNRGGNPAGARSTVRHMLSRDYPVSTGEFRAIMEGLGFEVSVSRYDETGEPLGPYVATCVVMQPAEDAAAYTDTG